MFIPPEILNKPDRLTDEEFEVMKTHTTLGYNLCMSDVKLCPYALFPLDHHEALDGTGYPNGLKKKTFLMVLKLFVLQMNMMQLLLKGSIQHTLIFQLL